MRIWNVRHARGNRREAALLLRLAGRQRESAHGASMKRVVKRDHIRTLGVISRQLKRGFYSFSAGVAVINLVRTGHGSGLRKSLSQLCHAFVIEVSAGHVN